VGRWRWLLIVVAVGVLGRLLFTGMVVGFDRAPFGDEIDYHALATNLAAGEGYALRPGYDTARRPPMYPAVLSVLYRLTGPSPPAARLLQVLLGGVIVWLTFLVARRFFSVRTAWLATIATALNPFLIFISGYMLTENLYIIALLGMLLLMPRVDSLTSWPRVAGAGVVLALASLARPTGFVVGWWIVAAVLLFDRVPVSRRLARCALLALAFVLVLLPWAVRNYRAFDRVILFTTHGGITFYQGNNRKVLDIPQYKGGVAPLAQLPGQESLRQMSQLDREEAAWALGKQFLKENKSGIPRLLWNKFRRFWRFRSDVGLSGIKSGWWFQNDSFLGRMASSLDVGLMYAIFAIPLFALGLIFTYRSWRTLLIIYGLIVCHTGITLIFHGSLRMRSPLEPIIAIIAAEALVRLVDRMRKRRTSVFSPIET
jgi:4-amino-4-deoxy-L-arabinose transferase-like glycosyltransferase